MTQHASQEAEAEMASMREAQILAQSQAEALEQQLVKLSEGDDNDDGGDDNDASVSEETDARRTDAFTMGIVDASPVDDE